MKSTWTIDIDEDSGWLGWCPKRENVCPPNLGVPVLHEENLGLTRVSGYAILRIDACRNVVTALKLDNSPLAVELARALDQFETR